MYSQKFYFLVMNNIFESAGKKVLHQTYDIKGSWVGRSMEPPREGKEATCRHCNQKFVYIKSKSRTVQTMINPPCNYTGTRIHTPNNVLKDNDLNFTLTLSKEQREKVLNQLIKDATALASFGIMDYSLLLGVNNKDYLVKTSSSDEGDGEEEKLLGDHNDEENEEEWKDESVLGSERSLFLGGSESENCQNEITKALQSEEEGEEEEEEVKGGEDEKKMNDKKQEEGGHCLCENKLRATRVIGPAYYYLGIIDMLQEWTWEKRLERFWKVTINGKDPDGVSCTPPGVYLERFNQKMRDVVNPADNEFFL